MCSTCITPNAENKYRKLQQVLLKNKQLFLKGWIKGVIVLANLKKLVLIFQYEYFNGYLF